MPQSTDRLSDTQLPTNFLSKHVQSYIGIVHHVDSGSKSTKWFKLNSDPYLIAYTFDTNLQLCEITRTPAIYYAGILARLQMTLAALPKSAKVCQSPTKSNKVYNRAPT